MADMKKPIYAISIILLVVGSFLVGSWYSQREEGKFNPSGSKSLAVNADKIPNTVSDTGTITDTDTSSLPIGTVKIAPEKQQLIGVRTGEVEKKAVNHTIRLLGRIVPDENRTYRITSSSELWIRKVYPPTTGSIVKKDEPLLAFYTTNFLSAAASYMYALNTLDRTRQSKPDAPAQTAVIENQIRQAVEALQNLGVSDAQIAKMARTRKIDELADVVSPANGFILSRNATLNQWVGSGTELYRIADLNRVWILGDIFEKEAQYFKPGAKARASMPTQKKTFSASVSEVLPIFDPATRTLKVRLETENPDFLLRPEMFVDVELPVALPPTITVPSDAILDSGLKKTVFVDLGNGFFEPREVETGWRIGNRVEITKGLESGERIVTSGTFLIDSESKLELAAQGMYTTLSKDPVCGLDVAMRKAEKAGLKASHGGKTYYFHSEECKQKFEKEPERYAIKGK